MDEEVAEVVRLCGKAGVEVHVRGTDLMPVVEVTTRRHRYYPRRVVGFVELRRRLQEKGGGGGR